MDPITIIAFFVVMAVSAVAGSKFGGISKMHRVEATDVSTGEKCVHLWMEAYDPDGRRVWKRETQAAHEESVLRALNNIQDAPK